MNNSITNATSIGSPISELIQELYLNYILTLIDGASLALLLYAMVLAIPQEVMHMWLSPKPFSIPNLLYALTRYGSLINQGISFWFDFLQLPGSLSLCNNLISTQDVVVLLSYVGVQGLLLARAYALCRGNKVLVGVLALPFGGGLALNLYTVIKGGRCIQSPPPPLVALAANICVILTDLIVFCTCIWKVWDTWKLKREAGIQSYNDLVSVFLKQTVSRFCFVIIFTVVVIIIDEFRNSTVVAIAGGIQHGLSAILLADFTLDLRQQNSPAIQAARITLPTIQIQSVVNYIHQSILVEMGDHETSVDLRSEENDDLSTETPDVGVGRELEESLAA